MFTPPRHFRFENYWMGLDGFEETVTRSWTQGTSCSDPFLIMHCKMTRLSRELKRWNSQVVGDMKLRSAMTSELIGRLDRAMDARQLTDAERQFRNMLKLNLLGIAAVQRSHWRQRSRMAWLKEGDANTGFFHARATARRRKKMILSLVHEGQTITGQEEKTEHIHQYFQHLIGEPRRRTHTLNFEALGIIPIPLDELEDEITEAEVKAAVFSLNGDKAPGPDGFTALFFQGCWNTVKTDLMAAIRAFAHLQTSEFDSLNAATMILLPKRADAAAAKDYRPISLVCLFAKIVTKVLATRLQPRMGDLVSPAQSAFIKGRVIHDNFTFVRGLARSYFLKKNPALLIKLDMEKAFDSLSWDFLLEVLEAKGFGQRWRNWITAVLATASTRVLVNGELTELIWHRRGLRQGDPLSPLLFVLAMDILSVLLDNADRVGVLKPIGAKLPRFRASLYADDVILFLNPCKFEITAARRLLDAFGEASGLCTNYSKSSISPIRCD
jgi:hypothetical protein